MMAVKLWLHMELGADETMTSERMKLNQGIQELVEI